MFISKRRWADLVERVESLELSEQKIKTPQFSNQSLRLYIRLFTACISNRVSDDPTINPGADTQREGHPDE